MRRESNIEAKKLNIKRFMRMSKIKRRIPVLACGMWCVMCGVCYLYTGDLKEAHSC